MEGSVVADQKMFKTFLLLNTQILDPEQNAACREFSKKKTNKSKPEGLNFRTQLHIIVLS